MRMKNVACEITYDMIDDQGKPVTGGTATAQIKPSGLSQVAATNTPTHSGGGQWSLALTQSECNHDSIGILCENTLGVIKNIDVSFADPADIASSVLGALVASYNSVAGSVAAVITETLNTASNADTNIDTIVPQITDIELAVGNPTYGTFAIKSVVDSTASEVTGIASTLSTAPADIADAVWDEPLADHLTAGSTGAGLNAAGSAGDPWATTLPGSYTGSQAGKILADVLDDTADLQANQGNWLTATGFATSGALTAVAADVTAILEDTGTTIPGLISGLNDLDAAGIRSALGMATGNMDTQLSTIDTVVDGIQSDLSNGTDGLGAIKAAVDGISIPSAADVADAVWTEALATHAALAGSAAEALDAVLTDTETTIPGLIGGLNDISAADVNAQVDIALADYDAPTKAELDAGFAALNDLDAAGVRGALGMTAANLDTQLAAIPTSNPSAAAIADAVWTETLADHSGGAGSTAEALGSATSGGGPSAADIADAVWDEPLAGHLAAGSTGSSLNAAGSAGDPWTTVLPGAYTGSQAGKVVADILADTADLQANQGNWVTAAGFATAAELAGVAVNVDAILVDTSTTIPAQISGLNDISAAEVNAQVDLALTDYDAPTKAEMDAGFAGLNDVTAADVADAVWTELVADHVAVAGSTAEALDAAAAGGGLDAAAVRAALGMASANLDSQLATIESVASGIQNDLDNGTDGLGSIKAAVDAVPTSNPSAASIADAVWTEDLSTHSSVAGSTAEALDVATAGGLDAAGVRAAIGMSNADLDAQLATIDTNVDALLVDTSSTLPGLISGLNDFDPAVDTVNVGAINGSTEAAADLAASAGTIVRAEAVAGSLTTTTMTTDLAEATNDHYNGRIIIWTSGPLKDQATNITDYDGTSKTLTFTAVTEPPQAGNTFVIV